MTFTWDLAFRVNVHSTKFLYISRCLRPFFWNKLKNQLQEKNQNTTTSGEGALGLLPYEFLSKACKQKKCQSCVTPGSKTKETCPKLSDLIGQARSLWTQGVCSRVWVQVWWKWSGTKIQLEFLVESLLFLVWDINHKSWSLILNMKVMSK